MSLIRNIVRETRDMIPSTDPAYQAWFASHRATPEELARQRQVVPDGAPSFSIVMPLATVAPQLLRETLASVVAQTYGKWELLAVGTHENIEALGAVLDEVDDERIRLISSADEPESAKALQTAIDAAQGEYVAFLETGDALEPDALFRYAEVLSEEDAPAVLYCDEDAIRNDATLGFPAFKPAFDRDLLYVHNYIGHFLAVRKSLMEIVGPFTADADGAHDYDLVLRCVAAGVEPRRVARMLYHHRADDAAHPQPDAHAAGRRALQHHFDARGIAAEVQDGTDTLTYRVRYQLPETAPLISIVIPNKDGVPLLRACVESIYEHTTYPAFEVLIVENNSEHAATFELYDELEATHDNLRIIRWTGEFNYASIVNFGASCARGELLLFLNNDTRVISPGWLTEMAGFFMRPEVGVVGAKLLYEDDTIQHAGIVVGQYDTVVHLNVFRPADEPGYLGRSMRSQNFSAVTGACQMTRAALFEELGGYDERFAVGFNDVDYCLRAGAAGFLTVWTPFAELYHAESATRGRDEDDPAKSERYRQELALFKQRWPRLFDEGDPYMNPNLKRASNYFTLPCTKAASKLNRLTRVLGRTMDQRPKGDR